MLTNSVNYSGLSDVVAFFCVVHAGSFTAAAEKLLTRTLNLTEIGQTFYNRACIGLKEIDNAEEEVSFLQGKPRGTLKINASLSFGVLHIAPALDEFSKLFPEMNVDLQLSDSKVDMIKEVFDLTIRITDQLEGNMIARKISPCHHVLVATPCYIKKFGSLEYPENLSAHNVITYQYQNSPWEWEFTKKNKTSRVQVHGSIQMNNSLAIHQAVLTGAGISRMPTFVVGEDIKQGRLIQLLPEYKLLERSIYIMFADRQHMAPKIRAFIDFFADRMKSTPSWDNFHISK
jgi:DNA-binding transcriptional LysR family regulator